MTETETGVLGWSLKVRGGDEIVPVISKNGFGVRSARMRLGPSMGSWRTGKNQLKK